MPGLLLVAVFALVAIIYASVGFGGGSSYNALLVISGTEYQLIPAISLSCNIIVVSGGVYHFYRAGQLNLKELLPFVVLAIPLAWLGGNLTISESTFIGLLGLVLLLSGAHLLWSSFRAHQTSGDRKQIQSIAAYPIGGAIGFVSGMVGIGGGIFLAPILYLVRWAPPRRIAALSSGFILLSSLAGLSGQLMKHGGSSIVTSWLASWPLFLAVLAGGQLGSRMGTKILPPEWIKRLTAVLIIYVAFRLLMNWIQII
jgi:uncharacterized membrane protein YfcA